MTSRLLPRLSTIISPYSRIRPLSFYSSPSSENSFGVPSNSGPLHGHTLGYAPVASTASWGGMHATTILAVRKNGRVVRGVVFVASFYIFFTAVPISMILIFEMISLQVYPSFLATHPYPPPPSLITRPLLVMDK